MSYPSDSIYLIINDHKMYCTRKQLLLLCLCCGISALAAVKLTEIATQVGKMVEHNRSKSTKSLYDSHTVVSAPDLLRPSPPLGRVDVRHARPPPRRLRVHLRRRPRATPVVTLCRWRPLVVDRGGGFGVACRLKDIAACLQGGPSHGQPGLG